LSSEQINAATSTMAPTRALAELPLATPTPRPTAEDHAPARAPRDLEAVYDIPVLVSAVLGRATMQVSQLLKLGRGAVVELDRKVGDPIDIFVNNRLIARGEVVMIDETKLGITMTEIVKSDRGG
jgi:flagellar motor switch protein FliN/FliY